MTIVAARCVGETARLRCAGDGPVAVVQSFARSLMLRLPDGLVIVATADIEPGPLTVLVSQDWPRLVAARNWEASGGSLQADDATIAVAAAPVWSPPPWPEPRSGSLPALAQDLARFLAAAAPPEGLAREIAALVTGEAASDPAPSGLHAHIQATAARRAQALSAWIASGVGEPPVDLVGLGDGSTPSGDDVLAGVLLVLAALRLPLQASLAAAVRGALADTSPLSAALLDEAAAGRAGESIVRAVGMLVAGDGPGLRSAAVIAARQGHSSGYDALAGVALAAAAVSGVP